VEFGLAASEREVFEAQVKLDDGVPREAGALALKAMLTAAKALIQGQTFNIGDESDQIISEFRTRFFDTRLFFDPYAKGKFANYLFAAHEDAEAELNADQAHQRIGEAQLFIEAAHSCYQRLD
jgi:sulfite reductase (ferredoxin)